MNSQATAWALDIRPPTFFQRVYSVWFRHIRVYTKHLFSNGFPPFIEPLFFIAGIGLGLGRYVGQIDGMNYILFLASGIVFPLGSLPEFAQWAAAIFPLKHAVDLVRALCFNRFEPGLIFSLFYIFTFIAVFGTLAIGRLKRRIVS